MSDKLLGAFIGAVKDKQVQLAEGAMLRPALQVPAEMGRVAGVYQGLQMALDILDGILRDDFEKEKARD